MIVELDPRKWGKPKATATLLPVAAAPLTWSGTGLPVIPAGLPTRDDVHPQQVDEQHEVSMATAAVVPAAPAAASTVAKPSGFVRFIDRVGNVFRHAAPYVEQLAVDAEPFVLALSPFGPEYDLVVNAIVAAQRNAAASLAAGVGLTGAQKMDGVLKAVLPALMKILESKGISVDGDVHAGKYVQVVYELHTLPGVAAKKA